MKPTIIITSGHRRIILMISFVQLVCLLALQAITIHGICYNELKYALFQEPRKSISGNITWIKIIQSFFGVTVLVQSSDNGDTTVLEGNFKIIMYGISIFEFLPAITKKTCSKTF